MKNKWRLIGVCVVFCLLVPAVSLSQAQGSEPPAEEAIQAAVSGVQTALSASVPIQGKLTDASGNPVPDASYSIKASIYNNASGGEALCSKTQTVAVSGGLFTMTVDNCTTGTINGQQLYLGIKVGSDNEMTPRQPIYPVPYAWSLLPGATISYTPLIWSGTYVDLQGNLGDTISWKLGYSYPLFSPAGRAKFGVDANASGSNRAYGVSGSADTAVDDGKAYGLYGTADATGAGGVAYGVYGFSSNGPGVYGGSASGPAIYADGDISQDIAADGLVKAGLYLYCSKTGSYNIRSFNNVGGTISVYTGSEEGRCSVDFGFKITDRYISLSTTGLSSGPHGVSYGFTSGDTTIEIFRWELDGSGSNGNVMVLIY